MSHPNRKLHRVNEDEEEEKHCYACNTWKTLDGYAKSKAIWDGYDRKCKACNKAYRNATKEQRNAKSKAYRDSHKKEAAAYKKATKEKYAEYNKDYGKKWRDENKESQQAYFKKHYQKNKKTIHARDQARRRKNPKEKVLYNMRTRINKALKFGIKSKRTMELVGCTIDEMKSHLENQFDENITWENNTLDGWHVDHIVPCAVFDMSDPIHQLRCFNYRNLQPLWGSENISKGDSMTEEAEVLLEQLIELFPDEPTPVKVRVIPKKKGAKKPVTDVTHVSLDDIPLLEDIPIKKPIKTPIKTPINKSHVRYMPPRKGERSGAVIY